MATTELPIDSAAPNYRVGTTIAEVTYVLDVRWNAHTETWVLDLLDTEADPIAVGLHLVLGTIIGARCADARFPKGAIVVVDLSGKGYEATIDDMGTRVKVYHYDAEDFDS